MKRSTLPLILVVLVALLACKAKPRITTETTPVDDQLMVRIDVSPASAGTARLHGQAAFEGVGAIEVASDGTARALVPLADVPMGKHTITVTFTGPGKGLASTSEGKTTFTFDRTPIVPTLVLKPVAQPGATTLTCKGDLCAEGTSLAITSEAKLSVDLTSCDGCTVEVLGQKFAVTGDSTPALVDLIPVVGAAPVSELASLGYLKVPLKVRTKEGGVADSSADLLGSVIGAVVFNRVALGPLTFPGDGPAADSPTSAIVVRRDVGYGVVTLVGDARVGSDIDLVGLAKASEHSLGSCGVYEHSNTKERVNVAHKGLSYQVTLVDRRTGKTRGQRSFRPVNQGCHGQLVAGVKTVYSRPAASEIDTWARTFFR
ncbi:MAG: hypothetical protein KF718_05950 [Polyangiaceae bacterium]|nr:hypothetical protein [Polyangiaceae bacterium]